MGPLWVDHLDEEVFRHEVVGSLFREGHRDQVGHFLEGHLFLVGHSPAVDNHLVGVVRTPLDSVGRSRAVDIRLGLADHSPHGSAGRNPLVEAGHTPLVADSRQGHAVGILPVEVGHTLRHAVGVAVLAAA